jgi:hypothetical protein
VDEVLGIEFPKQFRQLVDAVHAVARGRADQKGPAAEGSGRPGSKRTGRTPPTSDSTPTP